MAATHSSQPCPCACFSTRIQSRNRTWHTTSQNIQPLYFHKVVVVTGSISPGDREFGTSHVSLPIFLHKRNARLFAALKPIMAVASNVSHGFKSLPPETLLRSKSPGAMDEFEKQLQELFYEVKTMVMSGKLNEATDLLQANYEAVKEQMVAGAKGVEEAAVLDVIALGYTALGDMKMVVFLLDELNLIVDDLKDDEPILDSVLVHMGSMYSAAGEFNKSIAMYERALHILECLYGPDSTLLVTPLLSMAKVLVSIGKSSKAVDLYERTINTLELNRGVESEDLVAPLSAMGNLLIKEGKPDDAEMHFTRILNIYREQYGDKDGRVGMTLHSLANVKCAKGHLDEAIFLYKKAIHVIRESNYMAPDDESLEKMRVDLAELLHAAGRAQEGREVLEDCLLIVEKYKGVDHHSSATHLINLATSYSGSKNYAEAERLLRRSLQIMENSVPPEDQSITFPKLHLAVVLSCLNRDEEAERLALQVLEVREKAFGPMSLPVGEALDCLVSVQTRLGKDGNELVEHMRRVLRIQDKAYGNGSKEVMETLKKLIYLLEKIGDKSEKLPLQRRLTMLRKKHGENVAY